MKLMNTIKSFMIIAGLLTATTAAGANANAPEMRVPVPGSKVVISMLSDNGKWGVSEQPSLTDGNLNPSGGSLYNLETFTSVPISHTSGWVGVSDVTDDGDIVVGTCAGKPAYYTISKKEWTILEMPDSCAQGRLNAVTPDGHYACGYFNPKSNPTMNATPALYDLRENKLLELPGLPRLDMQNEDKNQNHFTEISADGRFVLGHISVSYMLPISLCSYIYDRETGSYNMIGFTEHRNASWTARVPDMLFIDSAFMSHDGHYVTGGAYMGKEIPGSNFLTEYRVAYRYDAWEDKFEIYDGEGENDCIGLQVLNDGTVLAVTPGDGNPWASMLIRYGNYFYPFDQLLKQVYDIDFQKTMGYEVTGKPFSASQDGLTLTMIYGQDESYIVKLKEDLASVCGNVDLLGSYTVTPKSGSTLSDFVSVEVKFTRNIAVQGDLTDVRLVDANGNTVRNSLKLTANGATLTASFRRQALEDGKDYKVVIDKGVVSLSGDRKITNKEIVIDYKGRAKTPVQVKSIYPVDGTALPKLDIVSNYVSVTFDTELKLVENSVAYIYREGETQPFTELLLTINNHSDAGDGRQMAIYPVSSITLYKGTNYRIDVPAGVVTDLSGNGGNEAFSINYTGTYERVLTQDDRYIFKDDCTTYENFLFYEGDKLTPAAVPASWGFTAETTPWYIVRESATSTDMAMASNSMYSPAGKADDWMTTPQLYIPDNHCVLTFQGQSYLKSKADRLKVIVYEDNNVYNTLNSKIVDMMRKGKVVFDEQLYPGDSEEDFSGDWTDYTVDLSEFQGKNIYICFVNENEDQSAIILDNIAVVRDMKFVTIFEHNTSVVNQQSIQIKGTVTVASALETFSTVDLTLRDGAGNIVDNIHESGLNLKQNDKYSFAFDKPLALTVGTENSYSVEVKLDDETQMLTDRIKNMAFQPVKKVVLEEYTGADCPNCPLGILAIQNLERLYPNNFIAMALHTYTGDPLGTGLSLYDTFLGCSSVGAPSGRINRGVTSSPMVSVSQDYRFSGNGLIDENGNKILVWLDYVRQELEQAAEAEVYFDCAYDDATGNVTVNGNVRSALTVENQNIGVFGVLLEDNVETYQSNNLSSMTDSDLGEWGKDGAYGTTTVYPYYANEVVRGWWGNSFNGTLGIIPTTLKSGTSYPFSFTMAMPASVSKAENCRMAVVLINNNTDKVINANVCAVNGSTGVEDIMMPGECGANVIALGKNVIVNTTADARVSIYNASGALIGSGSGNGLITVSLAGHSGVAIVKVDTANGSKVEKVVIK